MNNAPDRNEPRAAWQPEFWRQHPGFASVAQAASQICSDWREWPAADQYYPALSQQSSVRFVSADVLSYEDHVAETGEVPTRHACWHDLLNALIWQSYPDSKSALNRLHQAARQPLLVGQRGRRRDAATLFDENGALVWSDDEQLLALIRAMDWPTLFVEHRQAFGRNLHVRLFGHGLLDQLRQPFLGLTAHALLLRVNDASSVALAVQDAWLSEQIDARKSQWTPADLSPLPVLGIPDWWPGNDEPAFYQNRQYFRRERRRQPPNAVT